MLVTQIIVSRPDVRMCLVPNLLPRQHVAACMVDILHV
jgi:hypothetical protein